MPRPRRILPGDQIAFVARDLNAQRQLLNNSSLQTTSQRLREAGIVPLRVLNTTATDWDIGEPCRIAAPFDATDTDRVIYERAVSADRNLTQSGDQVGKQNYGITLQPIRANSTGWVAIDGVVAAKLQVADASHQYAHWHASSPSKLTTQTETTDTTARIVWKEAGTGAKWGKVWLRHSGRDKRKWLRAGATLATSFYLGNDSELIYRKWLELSLKNYAESWYASQDKKSNVDCITLTESGLYAIRWYVQIGISVTGLYGSTSAWTTADKFFVSVIPRCGVTILSDAAIAATPTPNFSQLTFQSGLRTLTESGPFIGDTGIWTSATISTYVTIPSSPFYTSKRTLAWNTDAFPRMHFANHGDFTTNNWENAAVADRERNVVCGLELEFAKNFNTPDNNPVNAVLRCLASLEIEKATAYQFNSQVFP